MCSACGTLAMIAWVQVLSIRSIQPENSTNLRIDVERTPLINRVRVVGGPHEVTSAIREICEIFSEAGKRHHAISKPEFISKTVSFSSTLSVVQTSI